MSTQSFEVFDAVGFGVPVDANSGVSDGGWSSHCFHEDPIVVQSDTLLMNQSGVEVGSREECFDYISEAIRTESPVTQELIDRLVGNVRSVHSVMGLQTEVGELTDSFKKHIFYGKPLDVVNVSEEASDCLWYMAILFDEHGLNFYDVMKQNIAKLRARYPEKFTESLAETRNLCAEREILESSTPVIG
jgi:NTP pyrophosphatase (non-canonical NTP hydrolase)